METPTGGCYTGGRYHGGNLHWWCELKDDPTMGIVLSLNLLRWGYHGRNLHYHGWRYHGRNLITMGGDHGRNITGGDTTDPKLTTVWIPREEPNGGSGYEDTDQ